MGETKFRFLKLEFEILNKKDKKKEEFYFEFPFLKDKE